NPQNLFHLGIMIQFAACDVFHHKIMHGFENTDTSGHVDILFRLAKRLDDPRLNTDFLTNFASITTPSMYPPVFELAPRWLRKALLLALPVSAAVLHRKWQASQ